MSALRLYSIPAHHSFVDTLASGLERRIDDGPFGLADAIVLVPHRRAVQAVSDAFLRRSGGGSLLLPEIRALGDVEDDEPLVTPARAFGDEEAGDDLPPSVGNLRRQLLLARQVRRFLAARGAGTGQAITLAGELARFLDQMQTEGLGFEALETLVPDAYAGHWQQTLAFLRIVTEHWPALLADEGAIDPVTRRDRLLESVARRWQASPPARPVIIAGSTGTVPATARLMRVVASLPAGAVVLPGLDRIIDQASWQAVLDDPVHPQHALARLLDRLEIDRDAVGNWNDDGPPEPPRQVLLREALRPAVTTDRWQDLGPLDIDAASLDGMHRIDCANPDEEARVIALLLREVLERPGGTAALITPDRVLAQRVKVALGHWDIEIEDSAGEPLADVPALTFWRLTAEMVIRRMAPVALLAALKHPMARCGMDARTFRRRVWDFERQVLRGNRVPPGVRGLGPHLRDEDDWLAALLPALAAFESELEKRETTLREVLVAHCAAAEAIAASDTESGADRLWSGETGARSAAFLAELHDAAVDWPEMEGRDYPAMLHATLAGMVYRPHLTTDPGIMILGPLEARMQRFDRLILGGLNEGSWPSAPPADPWMSRQMRSELGLPSLDVRIGQAAHDLVQACGAPEVFLTRSQRDAGTPTVPSRWLLRLDSVLDAFGLPGALARSGGERLAWARELATPAAPRPVPRPEPRPPVAVRPRRFSVTEIERLHRNPYSVYARRILHLKTLPPLGGEPDLADRGTRIHHTLELFVREGIPGQAEQAYRQLCTIGREVFADILDEPVVLAFWWPRFERIARWIVETEFRRSDHVADRRAEVTGEISIEADAGPVTLTGHADRIDRMTDGSWTIIDYKTGAVPKKGDLERGRATQLLLEALILHNGGFDGIGPGSRCSALEYWKLSGAEEAGATSSFEEVETLVAQAGAWLDRLLRAFDDPDTPYLVTPDPELELPRDDYAHLARTGEWQE